MVSTTTNYGWVKPDVGASDDVWGGALNTDLDGIDATVKGIEVRGMTPGPAGPKGDTGATGSPGAAGAAGPAGATGPAGPSAVSVDAGNSARLGADSLIYVPTPIIPPGTTVSDTPPSSPLGGQLWWDSVGGQLYVWFSDPNSSQWVSATNAAAALLPASTTVLGGVKVDGTTIKAASDGTISTTVVPLGDNRIINGDMRIDQRNGGTIGTASAYTVDRWYYSASKSGKGSWIRNDNASTLPAFPYGWLFTSSSAFTPAATDAFQCLQTIEADMVSDFAWGTTQAQPVTLSFWVYSSLTGTHGGAVYNFAGTRSYPFSYSIPVAVTWTRIVVTIPGDTSGTWVMSGNAGSVNIEFDLGHGSNYRGTAGAWVTGAILGVTGAVRVVSTNGAQFLLTGVKLEIGSVATPYNRQSLAKSQADCQRYYQRYLGINFSGYGTSGGGFFMSFPFTSGMRIGPNVGLFNTSYSNASSGGITATTTNFLVSAVCTTTGWASVMTDVNLDAEL